MENPYKTPEEVVSEALKRCREARRMSQQDVANRMSRLGLNWAHTTCSLLERGKRGLSVNEFVALALVLEVRPSALLSSDGPVAVGARDVVPRDTFNNWMKGNHAMGLDPDSQTGLRMIVEVGQTVDEATPTEEE